MSINKPLKVGIADFALSKAPDKLSTLGLGSCIGICIYDRKKKFGALIHILLPANPGIKTQDLRTIAKYADSGIDLAVSELLKIGASKSSLNAKIIGGANMFPEIKGEEQETIGTRNANAVIKTLQKHRIPIVSKELGGNHGRTVIFDLTSGDVLVKSGKNTKTI